jgi:hypothetical protein
LVQLARRLGDRLPRLGTFCRESGVRSRGHPFVLAQQLSVAREAALRQFARFDRREYPAPWFGVMAAVAEPALLGKGLDVSEREFDSVGRVSQADAAQPGSVDQGAA